MTDKAMVECSTGTLRTLVDGTVRLTIDVEPLNRDNALKAFSQPGTACVLAVLTQEIAKKEMVKAEADKAGFIKQCPEAVEYHDKHGVWPSNTADAICKEDNYRKYTNSLGGRHLSEMGTTDIMREICSVDSRSEFDTNKDAFTRYEIHIRAYRKFVQENK
jgi:hypothetical protein